MIKRIFYTLLFIGALICSTSCNNSPENKLIHLLDQGTARIQKVTSAEELQTVGTEFIDEFQDLLIKYPEIAYDAEHNEKVIKAAIRFSVALQVARNKFDNNGSLYDLDIPYL